MMYGRIKARSDVFTFSIEIRSEPVKSNNKRVNFYINETTKKSDVGLAQNDHFNVQHKNNIYNAIFV